MNLLVTGAWQQATDYLKQLKKEHDVVFMQWENKKLIKNASYVVTSSFHGIAFSIIYNREVYYQLSKNTDNFNSMQLVRILAKLVVTSLLRVIN